MINKFGRFLFILVAGVSLSILSGCNGTASPTQTTQPAEDITFQLSWTHEYSAANFYVAVENGHFKAQNLNVNIVEGGFGESGFIEPIDEVLSGESDFGTSSATSLIQARAEGKAVVGIATVLQRNPFALISIKDSNIVNLSDLAGKTIAVSDGAARTNLLIFLTQQGIDIDSITLVPRTTFGVEPLVNGDVDLLAGWLINEAVMVEEAGFEVNFILLSDYGLDDYNFVIFTSQDMVDNRPEVVDRFVRGFLAGLQDTISSPEKAIDAVLKYNSALDRQGQLSRLEVMLPLINPPGKPLGIMELGVWEQSQDVLLSLEILSEPIDLNTVFTNRFLDAIYGSN